MIDSLGRPQSVLLLGGTSEIALAILAALPGERLDRVVLLGRDAGALEATRSTVAVSLPGAKIDVELADAADTAEHGLVIDRIFDAGDIDVTVLAIGVLGDQAAAEADPRLAVRTATDGFVGPLSLMLHVGRRLRAQGHGSLVVLSSVAGRAARRSNYVYGATKAGLDLAALGLSDALAEAGAHVMVVRPGFVRTRMTAALATPPLAARPQAVGVAVAAGLRRRQTVVYPGAPIRALATVLSVLPRPVLRRLPF